MFSNKFLIPIIAIVSLITFNAVVLATSKPIDVVDAYAKGGSTFDILAKHTSNTGLILEVNNGASTSAKTNKKGWADFKKVYLIYSGKLSIKETVGSNRLSKYYSVTNGKVVFSDKDPTASTPIGSRSKTWGCTITANKEQDILCTPGAVFTNATQDTVCKKGYSNFVRNVSTKLKNQVYAEYDIKSYTSGEYEVDHLVSLELGGSNSIANLWPEAANPTPGFHQKDVVENKLHSEVCSGKIGLAEAQQQIADNWLNIYLSLFPPTKPQASAPIVTPPAPIVHVQPIQTLPPAPVASSAGIVKMSSTGICHAPGATYYDRTTNFTPYDSLQACLNAGGRLPLR